MRHTDQDVLPAPLSTTTAAESERPQRLRVYAADAPPAAWEDEWVDLGAEG